jgi:hypothetical protein
LSAPHFSQPARVVGVVPINVPINVPSEADTGGACDAHAMMLGYTVPRLATIILPRLDCGRNHPKKASHWTNPTSNRCW